MDDNVVLFPGVHSIEAPAAAVDVERNISMGGVVCSLVGQYAMTPTSEPYDDRRDQFFKKAVEVCAAGGWTMADFDCCMQAAWEAVHGWAEGMGRDFGR